MTDTLALFRAFVRVVEAGSFTRVAQEQNSSQPTVSRQVAALEEHLGTRLFTRTTRKLTLTDDGRGFYERAKLAIEAVSEAEDAVGRRRSRPSGALRLAMPVVFGRLRVIPHLKEFLTRYPEVSVDLVMNDANADLVEEGIDLAIRSGEIADSSLIARKIGVTRRVVVAAPSYLRGKALPKHPADLAAHDCLTFTGIPANLKAPRAPSVSKSKVGCERAIRKAYAKLCCRASASASRRSGISPTKSSRGASGYYCTVMSRSRSQSTRPIPHGGLCHKRPAS
jgi:DNA-binding transcriptional LysR family regulator